MVPQDGRSSPPPTRNAGGSGGLSTPNRPTGSGLGGRSPNIRVNTGLEYGDSLDDGDEKFAAVRAMFSIEEIDFEPAAPSANLHNKDGRDKDKGDGSADGSGDGEDELNASIEGNITLTCGRLLQAALFASETVIHVPASTVAHAKQSTQETNDADAPAQAGVNKVQLHAAAAAALHSYPHLERVLVLLLVAPDDLVTRRVARAVIRTLVMHSYAALAAPPQPLPPPVAATAPSQYFLPLLFHGIEHVYAYPEQCELYFDVVVEVIKLLPPVTDAAAEAWVRGTVAHLARLLRAHPIVEVGADATDVRDTVLQGLLRLIRVLLIIASSPNGGLDSAAASPAASKPSAAAIAEARARAERLKGFAGAPASEGGCDLIEEVFERCLFAVPSTEGNDSASHAAQLDPAAAVAAGDTGSLSVLGGRLPKAKAAFTRRAALDLLVQLSTDCPANVARLCAKVLPHHDPEAAAAAAAAAVPALVRPSRGGGAGAGGAAAALEDDDDTKAITGGGTGRYTGISGPGSAITPAHKGLGANMASGGASAAAAGPGRSRNLVAPRSSTGYVGLRNLGCICYMNSTMQQFFMTPAFRRGVLSWLEPAVDDAERAESLMYQLQRQFAYLQESEKQAYNPKGLCNSIKDWEGNPTDVTEQKDVPEFLTKLFTDMETQAQGTKLATLAKDVFGGYVLQELIAGECKYACSLTATSEGEILQMIPVDQADRNSMPPATKSSTSFKFASRTTRI
jgi:hypothetical protein